MHGRQVAVDGLLRAGAVPARLVNQPVPHAGGEEELDWVFPRSSISGQGVKVTATD